MRDMCQVSVLALLKRRILMPLVKGHGTYSWVLLIILRFRRVAGDVQAHVCLNVLKAG